MLKKHHGPLPHLSLLLLLCPAVWGFWAFRPAQTVEADYSLHSKYMYHFTKYFEWPPERQSGPFIMGIYANQELYLSLKNIADKKKVNNRNLLVVALNPEEDPINCHMLFVGRPALRFLDKIILKTADKPIILLSDKMGYLRKGSDINFLIKDNQLRFELAAHSIESKHIKIANEIKALALPSY